MKADTKNYEKVDIKR